MDVFIPDPSIIGSDSLAAVDSNARFLEAFSFCMPHVYCLLKVLHIPLASIALSTCSLGVYTCLPTKVIVCTGQILPLLVVFLSMLILLFCRHQFSWAGHHLAPTTQVS